MPSKYGFGNTRKKSPYTMGKAHYGKDQKNPIMLTKEGKEKIMASDANPNFKKAIANSPIDMYGKSPMDMYGKSPARKYKSDAQRKAVHASKAESPAKLDFKRIKAGIKGALRGAAANEGTSFPGYDPQGNYSKWGGKYPGSDIIQGYRGGIGMYDQEKAKTRQSKVKK